MNDNENNITPNDIFNSQVPNTQPVVEEPKPEIVPPTPVETPPVVPQPVVEEKKPESVPTMQFNILSPWAYIGYNILFSLPIIGIIMMIVFAVDKDTYNINRRNYARSMLYAMLLVTAIFTAIIIIMIVVFGTATTVFTNMFTNITTAPTAPIFY